MRVAKRLAAGVLVALFLAVVLGWLASCSHPPSYSPTAPTSTAPAPTPPAPAPSPAPAPGPVEWHPGRAAVLDIKADFVGNVDAEGRVMFDIFLPGLPADQQADWIARRKAEGVTHLVVDAEPAPGASNIAYQWDMSGPAARLQRVGPMFSYPGYPAPEGGFTPATLAAFVAHLLDDEHIIPIVVMNGGFSSNEMIDAQWPAELEALQSRQADLIVMPCFECIGPGGIDASYANAVLRHYLPQAVLMAEPMPSAPGFPRTLLTGDWDIEGYEAPNSALVTCGPSQDERCTQVLLRPDCSPTDHTGCWLSQLRDELADRGTGRPQAFSLLELCAYDRTHGTATDPDCHRLTAEGLQVCQQMGVNCSWGNGSPQ